MDLARDGVAPAALKAGGDGAVWHALVSTATSAQIRGQGFMDWEGLVTSPQSRLGTQMRLKDGDRALSPKAVATKLTDAWDAAWVWRSERPAAWSAEEVREQAERRCHAMTDVVADADADLIDGDRAVLAYAIEQTRTRGMLQVTLPWRDVQQATGLGEKATKNGLERLTSRGLLVLVRRGRSSGQDGKRRASLYGLPTTDALALPMSRGTRPMGPPAQTYGTPASTPPGTPRQTYGTPSPDSDTAHRPTEENPVMTLTYTPDGRRVIEVSAENLPMILAALERGAVEVVEEAPTETRGNVVPLSSARSAARA
ncbi:MAG: hypothetical protein ACOH1Y_15880 [Propionicimonas sp.]